MTTPRAFVTAACLGLALAAGCREVLAAGEVVPVVSARSAVTSLSAGQVADLFLGKTVHFPDGSSAVPIDLPEQSQTRERFYAQYTGKSPSQVKAHWSKIIFTGRGQPPMQAATGLEAKRLIAANPNAIGYVDDALVDSSLRVVGAP
ncbi:MAG TPA: phosphate ABC transporter substrate-binding protein [Usitatibacter sp.]|nr:phosphate ABC transporter substrate-binding protein [Usitatibacter sp.]